MKEDLTVYQALRAHILQKEGDVTNEVIYMYVTYFALLSVGAIWNNWVCLLSFVDLIVFQSMINSSQWSITKASIYIRVFFEAQYDNIHWETFHQDDYYQSVYNATNRNIGWYFRKFGAAVLSVISFLSILLPALHEAGYNFYAIPSIAAVQMTLALILCGLTVYVNSRFLMVQDDKSPATNELHKAIEKFHDHILHEGAHPQDLLNK